MTHHTREAVAISPHPVELAPELAGERSPSRGERVEWLCLAIAITLSVQAITRSPLVTEPWRRDLAGLQAVPWPVYRSLALLAFGLLLALPSRRRSGLCWGNLRPHRWRVLLVCGLPPLLTALVYPHLPVRPFASAGYPMWLVSPAAQSLIFIGFLYGRLEPLFPRFVHPRVPVRQALVLVAVLFALWHTTNFFTMPAGYVLFQLFYTSVLYIVPALSRQWTGSILYVVLCHSAINFIAWSAS